jgi:hypothetical protein
MPSEEMLPLLLSSLVVDKLLWGHRDDIIQIRYADDTATLITGKVSHIVSEVYILL